MAMMEADCEALCSPETPPPPPPPPTPLWRGGSTPSRAILGGSQVEVARLRVCSAEGEVASASLVGGRDRLPVDTSTMEVAAASVPTRAFRTRRLRRYASPLLRTVSRRCLRRLASRAPMGSSSRSTPGLMISGGAQRFSRAWLGGGAIAAPRSPGSEVPAAG